MTTIAANRECMAADSLCDYNGLKTPCTKIYKISGDIVACAGDTQEGKVFLRWYAEGGDEPSLTDEFEALVLTHKGCLYWYGHRCMPELIELPYFAIGSGSHIAMLALKKGLSPDQAVYEACEMTTGSAPPVRVMRRT